jgi:RHS repeat-associated protein
MVSRRLAATFAAGLVLVLASLGLVGCSDDQETTTTVPLTQTTTGQAGPTEVAQPSLATEFAYDPNGNVTARTDSNGDSTTYVYDAVNRLTAINYPDGSSVNYVYDSLGRRVQMTDKLGTTSYEYDIHGRLTKVTDPHGNSLQYAYDAGGNLTELTYPDGSQVAYTWKVAGELESVTDSTGTTRYQYDPAGNLSERVLPNGVITRYEYDDAARLTAITHTSSSGTLLLGFAYELDAMGNRTQATRIDATGSAVTRYEYDDLGRLAGVGYPNGESVTYEYDAIGNRTRMASSVSGETRYSYDGLGQLTQLTGPQGRVTFQYDAAGNLAERMQESTGFTTRYTWDFENRLIGVDDGTRTISYQYDGDGNRLGKTVDGISTEYINNISSYLPQILSEHTDGQSTINYTFGFDIIGRAYASGQESFYLCDSPIGNIGGVTDINGAVTDTYVYDVFGSIRNRTGLSVDTYSFKGAYTDSEIGLYLYAGRAYDPSIGRLTSSGFGVGEYSTAVSANSTSFKVDTQRSASQTMDWLGLAGDVVGIAATLYFLPEELVGMGVVAAVVKGMDIGLKYIDAVSLLSGQDTIRLPTNALALYGSLLDAPFGQSRLFEELGAAADLFQGGGKYEARLSAGGISALVGSADAILDVAGYTDKHIWQPLYAGLIQPLLSDWGTAGESADTSGDPYDRIELSSVPFGVDPWGDDSSRKYYSYPWDDGGGGGGAAVAFGGVSLDQAAKVLVDLNDITGASYDPKTGQVTLIGRKDLTLPPMNMDDLVVAIRSIYGSGEDPGVTMNPVDPTMKDITQRVLYFGQTEHTHFGQVMFEADRYLKSLAAGTDTLTRNPVDPDVPGFKSELDLCFELNTTAPWHRNWFVPGEVVLKQSKDGHSMVFDEATIVLQSRFIKFTADGTTQDVPGSSPVTDRFTAFVTEHYDELAAEKPELAELKQLAKIVGLVRWLHDNDIPVDLSWVSDYQVAYVDTPDKTPGIVASDEMGSRIVEVMGGVGYDTDNTYSADADDSTAALAKQAVASRPADSPVSWNVDNDGEKLTAVAFNVEPTEIVGGYSTRVTDVAISLAGGGTAGFTRQYNSLDLSAGSLGNGWSHVAPELAFEELPDLENPETVNTYAVLISGTDRREFSLRNDGSFRPVGAAPGSALLGVVSDDAFTPAALAHDDSLRPGLLGQPVQIRDNQGLPLAYKGFALAQQDGSVLAFDPSGRLTAERDARGHVVTYLYTKNQLTTIADSAGHGLQFAYDSNKRLVEVASSDGHKAHYIYDGSGNLTGVTDETGAQIAAYGYGPDDRLNRVTDQYGLVTEITYDGRGRVVSSISGTSSWTAAFDDATNMVSYTDADGSVLTRRYDDQNRLLSASDPLGNSVAYKYDTDDRVTSVTDPNGGTTTFTYDKNGALAETVSPLGDKTMYWNYNEFGLPEAAIDSAQQITFYAYDERGRLAGVQSGYKLVGVPGDYASEEVDPFTVSYSYDASGNLVGVEDSSGSLTHLLYDESGNLTSLQLPGGGEFRQAFDDHSRLTSIADATGHHVDLAYDEEGRLTGIATTAGRTEYQYDAGRLSLAKNPLGRVTRYSYDQAGRLVTVTDPTGAVTKYKYDASGNLTAVVDPLGGRVEYRYDAVGRLTGIYR